MGVRNSGIYDFATLFDSLRRDRQELDTRVTRVVDYLKTLGLDEIRRRLSALEAIHPHQYPDCDCVQVVGGTDFEQTASQYVVIAASDAPQRWKDAAAISGYQCDGLDDKGIISTAFSENPFAVFLLSPGTFKIISDGTTWTWGNKRIIGAGGQRGGFGGNGKTIVQLWNFDVTYAANAASLQISSSSISDITFQNTTFGTTDIDYVIQSISSTVERCLFASSASDVYPNIAFVRLGNNTDVTGETLLGGYGSSPAQSHFHDNYFQDVNFPRPHLWVSESYLFLTNVSLTSAPHLRIILDAAANCHIANIQGVSRDSSVVIDPVWDVVTIQNGSRDNLITGLTGHHRWLSNIASNSNPPRSVVRMASDAGLRNRVDTDTIWWYNGVITDGPGEIRKMTHEGSVPVHTTGGLVGPTGERPPIATTVPGTRFFDTDINVPLVSTGSNWVGIITGGGPGPIVEYVYPTLESDVALPFTSFTTP